MSRLQAHISIKNCSFKLRLLKRETNFFRNRDNRRLYILPRRIRQDSKSRHFDIYSPLHILLNSFFTPFAIFYPLFEIMHGIN